jgi:hypothetical protein
MHKQMIGLFLLIKYFISLKKLRYILLVNKNENQSVKYWQKDSITFRFKKIKPLHLLKY